MVMVAIYSRKSKFTGKGDSLQNQIEMCKEYIERNFKVDDFLIYEDEGYSGSTTKRPKYTQMMADMSKGQFHILICYRLDRVSRNIADFSNLVELLQKYTIDFISIREQFDTSTPMGRAMMYIASVFAQLERETIAERIRDNMHQLARTGRWLGGKTPTGFTSKETLHLDEHQVQRRAYQLSPLAEELKTVKEFYEKYIELGSLTQLESWTLEKGIQTRKGRNYDKSTLKSILSNPVYAIADQELFQYFLDKNADIASPKEDFNGESGLMVFNKHDERKSTIERREESQWIVALGLHQGIIAAADWIKVQKMLRTNSTKAPRAGTSKHGLLTRLLRCHHCGSKMRVSVSKRKTGTYYYYKCLLKEHSRGSLCQVPNINGPIADEKVMNEIKKIKYRKNDIYLKLKEISNTLPISLRNADERKKKVEGEIRDTTNRIDTLTMQLSETKETQAGKYIIGKIQELDYKIQELQSKIADSIEMKDSIPLDHSNIDFTLHLIENFSEALDAMDFREKKRMLNELLEEITWDGETLQIRYFR